MIAKTKPTPAVSYIRMSSGKQEVSPEQQRAEVVKLAKTHNCRLLREYFDSGISGDNTEKRTDFRRMIADAEEKGDFAAILCWDQDRFGRFDSIEAGRWIYPLRKAGVWLITVGQGIIDWNDFAGRMMYSIQQEGKYQYLIDLSRNVLRGRIASAKAGRMVVAPCCGYDRLFFDETGTLARRVAFGECFSRPKGWTVRLAPAQDAAEIETIRWLFHRFATTDCSLRSLVVDLNGRNIPTRRKRGWSAVAVQYILANPAYIGAAGFGRRRSGKYRQIGDDGEMTSERGHGLRKAPIMVEGTHEALVDRDTFDQVQTKLDQRKQSGAKPRGKGYLLSGVVLCGHCSRRMVGKVAGSGNRYYHCPGADSGRCAGYSVRQDALDDFVFGVLEEKLFSRSAVNAIKAAIHRQAKARGEFKQATAGLKVQLEAMEKKIAKGTENLLLADPKDIPDLSALLATWKQDRTKLQAELEAHAVNPTGTRPAVLAERAIQELKHLRKHLQSADVAKSRHVVKAMVADITLWWERDGKRNHRVAKGILNLRPTIRVLEGSSNTACLRFPRETAAP